MRFSLRLRAAAGVTVLVAAALSAGGWFIVVQQRTSLMGSVETTARLRADDLVVELQDGTLPQEVAVPFEESSFVQIVAGGEVVRASPNIDGEPRLATFVPRGGGALSRVIKGSPVGTSPFVVVAQQAHSTSGSYVVYVGQSTAVVRMATRRLLLSLLVAVPLLVLLLAALTLWTVARALRPVEAMRAEVEVITGRGLDRRLPEPGTRDEIQRLATTMNQMLDRLQRAAQRQQGFVADASHELRSPITALRAQLEVNLSHPQTADWTGTGPELLLDAIRLQRLVDDLLTLAKTDRPDDVFVMELADLDDIVLSEARRLRERGAIDVDASGVGAAQVQVDVDAIRRAVRNLLDNAERHARNTVVLQLAHDGQSVNFTVADDGRGVPESDHDRIFERFARSDTARGRDSGGTGLGLPIAREIALAHGGTLTLLPTAGGAVFRLGLPSVGPDERTC